MWGASYCLSRGRVAVLLERTRSHSSINWLRGYATETKSAGERGIRGMRWFGIPAGLGIACLAALQLQRTVRRERGGSGGTQRDHLTSWQLAAFQLLPARLLSRGWGKMMERELPVWLRRPLLGLYVRVFNCNMEEAVEEELVRYGSFSDLFTRQLKAGTRPVSSDHSLVCPADGKVLHLGRVDKSGRLEQIKGVSYDLCQFLGQPVTPSPYNHKEAASDRSPDTVQVESLVTSEEYSRREGDVFSRRKNSELYHVTIYLAPGDYHGFHSPAIWNAHIRRHFPGELLTVAPWAVKTMPGLFTLNERVLLLGQWEHGFFSFAAVGAYNVGSISLAMDEKLKTNQRGHYIMGQFSDKQLSQGGHDRGLRLAKGQRLGTFKMGSSIVLVFEAPTGFEFSVHPGDTVKYGQPLGHITHR